ncbi:hypothetical protein LCGC14_1564900 [marine sediment metagenome]|uniref:Uncharacterized protein n=1 Tax=marine sediment metagenome TaxID=412755 RepID=A0A0F9ILB9_9ZZZZ
MPEGKTLHVFTIRDKNGKVTKTKEFYVGTRTGKITDQEGKKVKEMKL